MARLLLLSGLGLLSAITYCPLACKNQAPPAAEAASSEPKPSATLNAPPAPATGSVPAAPAVTQATEAKSQYNEAGFDLVIQPKGPYASGQAGDAEVVLSAKAPFHVNDKYPYKFKIKQAPGLTFANLVVARDAVKLEPARATVPLTFTPESGKHTLSGQLSFSVCKSDQCMIEKRDLALEIDAK